jgi:signal peptidase I
MSPQAAGAVLGRAFGAFVGAVVVVLVVWTFAPLLWGWKPFVVTSDSMAPAARRGDVILVDPTPTRALRPGDVVTYRHPGTAPVTHRLVGGDAGAGYLTKGDANLQTDPQPVASGSVLGRVRVLVPLLGWPGLTLRAIPVAVVFLAGLGWVCVVVVRHRRRSGVRACVAVLAAVTSLSGSVVAPTYAAFAGTTSTAVTAATRSRFYPQAVLAAGPAAYWRLGESGGTSRADQMGANPLTCNGATGGSTGAIVKDTNTATRLPVNTARCAVAGGSALSMTSSFTVVAWERSIIWPQTTNGRIVTKYGGGNNTLNYMIAWDSAGTAMRALIDTTSGRYTAIKAMTNNTNWHMIVMVWDTVNLRLYIDGVSADGLAAPGTPVTTSTAASIGYFTSDSMIGDIDEVAIFARALSASEISDLYTLAQ